MPTVMYGHTAASWFKSRPVTEPTSHTSTWSNILPSESINPCVREWKKAAIEAPARVILPASCRPLPIFAQEKHNTAAYRGSDQRDPG